MYFLNGDRIYLKPAISCKSIDEQLIDCLQQLTKINSQKKVFKLNFFVDIDSKTDYLQLQQKISKEVASLFPDKILQSLIGQPPLTCKVIVEACFYDTSIWQTTFFTDGFNGAVLMQNETSRVLIGNVQSYVKETCKLNAEKAFDDLAELFNSTRFSVGSIVRQWNYLENILGFDGTEQRYQTFNNARTDFYGNCFVEGGYPAATGIGMNHGGIIIEFLAIESSKLKTVAINNPLQIAAHEYSEKVLLGEKCSIKTSPKFERARYLELDGKKIILISGTASIIGERTVGVGNHVEQTEITIENIKRLYSSDILEKMSADKLNPVYGHARVYLKNRKDYAGIKQTFKRHFGNLPVVFIVADICRNDLLVEIEGKVILE